MWTARDVVPAALTMIGMTALAFALIWLGTVLADGLSFDLYWTRMVLVLAAFAAVLLYSCWRSPQDET